MRLWANLNDVKMADRAAREPARRAYHHGDLRAALVAVAEEILTERGVAGFTLREAARRAGVSPAAPAHHFGDAAGLLTEVAIAGFEALTHYLREGNSRGGKDPAARLRGQGEAYVRFALDYPARFQLMFRRDLLAEADERLQAAGRAAFAELEDVTRAIAGAPAEAPLAPPSVAALLGAWSMVHGFAHLALDGQLDHLAGGAENRHDFIARILPEMLRHTPMPARRKRRP